MLRVWQEEGRFVLQTCLCWQLEKPSTASFIAPGGVKELTKYSFNLFEAAFISPEGGEWNSQILRGMCLIQDCPFSLTPQTLQEESRRLERGSQIYSHFFQSPGLSGCWVSLSKVWPKNSVFKSSLLVLILFRLLRKYYKWMEVQALSRQWLQEEHRCMAGLVLLSDGEIWIWLTDTCCSKKKKKKRAEWV